MSEMNIREDFMVPPIDVEGLHSDEDDCFNFSRMLERKKASEKDELTLEETCVSEDANLTGRVLSDWF